MTGSDELYVTLRRFAATMATEDYEVTDVLVALGDSVVTMLEVTGAGMSIVDGDGVLRFVTATGERINPVERAQEEHQDGPCMSAYREQRPVAVADLDEEDRWPAVKAAADAAGLRSVIGLPLSLGSYRFGTPDIYDSGPHVWTADQRDTAQVLADIATSYVIHASNLDRFRRLSEQLQEALESRVVIEQAKGRISSQEEISVDEAFDRIRDHCRRNKLRLRDVARDIVEGRVELGRTARTGTGDRDHPAT